MPRKPPRRTTTPDDEPERRIFPPSPFIEPDPDEETLAQVVDQFGPGDLQIKVYKISDGVESFCHTFNAATEANEESVRRLGYGPGRYNLKIIIGGVFRKVQQIAIAERQGGDPQQQRPQENAVLEMMKQQNLMLQNLLTSLIANKAQASGGVGEVVAAMRDMQAMNPAQVMTPELIKSWVDVGRTLSGNGGGADDEWGWIKDIAKSAAPALVPLIMQRPPVPEPRNVTPQPQPQIESQPEVQQMSIKLKLALEFLKQKCIAKKDPGLYIDWIIDNHENADFQQLIRAVVTQEFSAFTAIDPEIGTEPFVQFFRTIYDGLRSAFTGPDTVAADSGGPDGNTADARGDEQASKPSSAKSKPKK